jgi:hypothetical protein
VKLQNEEIAKKLAMKTNKQPQKKEDELETQSSNAASEEYKVGDFVRNTYKDNVDYEAEILSINENGTALIKYIGYGNEERVKVEELTGSWGVDHREQQKADAEIDNAATPDEEVNSQEDLHNFVVNKSKNLHDKLPIPPMVSTKIFLSKRLNFTLLCVLFSRPCHQACLRIPRTQNTCQRC